MSIDLRTDALDSDVSSDLDAVLRHVATGAPLDTLVSERVRRRSERLTEDLRRTRGELNVAVGLVREIRDEP
jgi:hypothetical protein